MEKVKIRKCESIMDGQAWAVEFADGRKATAWEDKIDCKALHLAYDTMSEIEVELKPYKSKAGKEGLNIVKIFPDLQTIYDAKQGNCSTNGQYQKSVAEEKDGVCQRCGGSGCDNCDARYVPQMPKPIFKENVQVDNLNNEPIVVPKPTNLMSTKDIMIISQCLTKAWCVANNGSVKYQEPKEVLEAYRFFVLELENNG